MKTLIILGFTFFMGCSTKPVAGIATTPPSADSATAVNNTIPACVQALIKNFEAEEKQNPPRSIYSYTYQGKLIYYVPAICCDFFSDLYDAECKLLGHPDGGFTGRGDGNFADFATSRSGEKLIWKDNR